MRWVQPEEKSRVIKVDQIRDLVDFSQKTASFGERKVLVLAPADSMNASAANALLKSLEEPAADTYLVLVCHRLHGLPATIRSRCQMLRLPAPGAEASRRWLDRQTGSPEESVQLLSLAHGLPLLAEQYYRAGEGAERTALQLALRSGCLGEGAIPEIAERFSTMAAEEVLGHMATALEGFLRDLDQGQLASPRGRGVFGLLDEIARLQRAVYAGANPNPQLMTEGLLAKSRRVLGEARLGDNIKLKEGRIYE
jgi:DNA polymerase-3 subunit delta'